MNYEDFLVQKQIVAAPQGIGVPASDLHPRLFDWQAAITSWALRRGRSALIEDCGLGKTFQQLEWSRRIHLRHGYNILILAPLAVAEQTKAEGDKFDIPVNLCRDGSHVIPGINITNYELLHRFDTRRFAAVVLDESSILKSHTGQTRNQIIDLFAHTEYRLACTATPAPNDHMELGNHAEFLGVMNYRNMLATFFVHDGGDTSKWRLKGHAADAFWRWVSSWAMMIGKPSDIGFSDDGFTLPPIHRHQITVESDAQDDEYLFSVEARGMLERNAARKDSLVHRVAACADIVNATREPFLVWCDRNPESEALAAAIPGAVEVTGSDTHDYKRAASLWFTGDICDCQFAILSGSKKPICGSLNTRLPDVKSTQQAKPKEQGDHNKQELQKPMQNTCATGTKTTKKRLRNIGAPLLTKETQGNVNSMRPIQTGNDVRLNIPKNGEGETQKDTFPKESSDTEFPSTNTDPSSPDNAVNAPSARATAVDPECTSTTITEQESSEGCCVPNAILESANSETTQISSLSLICTCGGVKHKRVLISKPSIFGFGLNFQHCANIAFVGLSDSFEQIYQAERRCWRFGQTKPVNVYVFTSEREGAVVANINRKQRDFEEMSAQMRRHMQAGMIEHVYGSPHRQSYSAKKALEVPSWLQ